MNESNYIHSDYIMKFMLVKHFFKIFENQKKYQTGYGLAAEVIINIVQNSYG